MHQSKLVIYLLISLLFTLSGCFYDEEAEEVIIREKVVEEASPTGGCPTGKWGLPTCNGATGKNLIYFFGDNGKGYSSNPECSNMCSGPMVYHFNYKVSGNTITYNFTATDKITCGGTPAAPSVPSGTHSITFTCLNNGTQLRTETVNIQSGVKSVNTFNRM